jgi:hypothetical protein
MWPPPNQFLTFNFFKAQNTSQNFIKKTLNLITENHGSN